MTEADSPQPNPGSICQQQAINRDNNGRHERFQAEAKHSGLFVY